MENEIINQKPWLHRNLKWFIPSCIALLICIIGFSSVNGSVTDMAQAYTDPALCQNAVNKANQNKEVTASLGILKPVDKLAVMEGAVIYSNDGNTVEATIRVIGTKGNAKMDISADKCDGSWNYKSIRIRNKKTGSMIQIK